MATRECLGKIRWVRRLPVHTLLSLETVKDYQLLTFSKSGPPRSQPTLSFFNSLQAHTGLALPWFLCKNWFPAHLLLQRLSNWLPDKRHAVFFFFLFIGIIPRHLIGCRETTVSRGLLAGLQPCLWTHTGGTGICQAEFPPAFISLAARQTSGFCQDVESKFLNTEEAWNLTFSPGAVLRWLI